MNEDELAEIDCLINRFYNKYQGKGLTPSEVYELHKSEYWEMMLQQTIKREQETTLKRVAVKMRALESWGQLNIKDFPLVTALVESMEQGILP